MALSVELSESQLKSLQDRAERLGIKPRELARAAIADLLDRSDDEFQRAANHVLYKNRELYDRLS